MFKGSLPAAAPAGSSVAVAVLVNGVTAFRRSVTRVNRAGRICGPILQRLMGCESQQVRPPVIAASIGTLAAATNYGQ
jgi:hypothetical protein